MDDIKPVAFSDLPSAVEFLDRTVCALLETEGEVGSNYFAFLDAEGRSVLADASWDGSNRDAMLRTISWNFAMIGVRWYAVASEAWLARVDRDKNPELLNVPPSQRADRREVIMILGVHEDGTQIHLMREINRNPDGSPWVGERENLGYDSLGGAMANLIPIKGGVHHA